MKKRTTRLLALFLALILMISGCTLPFSFPNDTARSDESAGTDSSGSQTENRPQSADAQKTQDQFSKLCKELFEEEVDDLELVAVITAAVAAAMGETSTDGFQVRSIKRAKNRNW